LVACCVRPVVTTNAAPSSSGLGRSPLKAEIAGSNPAGATKLFHHCLMAEGVPGG
jgi:hypothetical protein